MQESEKSSGSCGASSENPGGEDRNAYEGSNAMKTHLETNTKPAVQHKEAVMKAAKWKRALTSALVIALISVMVPAAVWALGTTAGTGITNSVSVNYTIGGVPGSAIVSSATFTVGMRVNGTVTRQNAAFVDVAGGATGAYLTFLVTNTTNTSLDFGLVSQTASTNPFTGTASDFAAPPALTAYVDSNGNSVYDSGVDTATFSAISSDASVTVFLVGNIPAGELNGAIQAYSLTAVARGAGTGGGAATNLAEGAGTYNSVDVVFGDAGNGTVTGDAARDARISDRSAFRITALTVNKTAAVYWDPFNLFATPRAIPGAILTYTVTISNPGAANATSVSISDALGALPVTFATQFDDGVDSCGAGEGIVVDNLCYTNAADGGTPDANEAGGTISVSGMTVNAGATTVIKYQVTVN